MKRIKKDLSKDIDLKYKIILVIIFVIIDIFLIFSFIRVRDAVNYNKLSKEFDKAIKVDFTVGNYNEKIVSHGKYKEVEEYIKDYFNDYSDNVKDILKEISDSKFTSLLSIDTYKNSNGDFTSNINYVVETKDALDSKFNYLNKYSTDSGLTKYINKKTKDKEIRKIFLNFMLSNEAKSYFEDNNQLLGDKQEEVDNILEVSRDVYYFLTINNGKWIIDDNQIKFSNNDLMNQYNQYISKLQ